MTDLSRLVAEAASKSGLLWVEVPGDRAWPVWHVWVNNTAYVVSGPGEQPLPDLPDEVVLVLRSKDHEGRLLRVPAHTRRLSPEDADLDDEWGTATQALKASRLNAPPGDTVARWAHDNVVMALSPHGDALEEPGHYDDASGAAAPVPTPATTATWRPWHARGRPRVRRRRRRRA
ncbi:hypothetical protein [Segeticoccus rhizosphaerae]|uniref:hypothetical protein n=2 Tax=Segeticoccus rhizosphaerae TaxID=1104777 RepID=UPI0010C0F5AB|nr:hypothetical protein [Ornithinicoccus soli]